MMLLWQEYARNHLEVQRYTDEKKPHINETILILKANHYQLGFNWWVLWYLGRRLKCKRRSIFNCLLYKICFICLFGHFILHYQHS